MNKNTQGRRPPPLWYLLLVAPCIAMFWVSSYNRVEPAWGGVPFFYWYQLLWIPIGADRRRADIDRLFRHPAVRPGVKRHAPAVRLHNDARLCRGSLAPGSLNPGCRRDHF